MKFFIKAIFAFLFFAMGLHAQPAHIEQILPTNGGDAVAMDKEWAVVSDVDTGTIHVYKLDYSNFQWVEQNFPAIQKSGRYGASVAISGETIVVGRPMDGVNAQYIYGLIDGTLHTTRYDISANIWTVGNDAPGTVGYGSAMATVGSDIYAFQGGNTAGFWKFDTTTETWASQPAISFNVRGGGDMVFDGNNSIYATRGVETTGSGQFALTTYTQDLYEYNISTSSWSTVKPIPLDASQSTPYGGCGYGCSMAYDGAKYIYLTEGSVPGGFQGLNAHQSKRLLRYDTTTDSWDQTLADAPATFGHGAALVYRDGYLYTYRGDPSNSGQSPFYVYDIAGDSWSTNTTTTVPNPVAEGGSLINAGKDLFGWNGNNTNNFFQFTVNDTAPTTGTWSAKTADSTGFNKKGGSNLAVGPRVEAAVVFEYDGTTWNKKFDMTSATKSIKGFGSSVEIQEYNVGFNRAHVAVGAPKGININLTPQGIVETFEVISIGGYTPLSTLQAHNLHAMAFGASLDMKGDYLIVGAPDERAPSDPLVGAAYTFKFDGGTFLPYPSAIRSRIKLSEVNTRFGTYVAINKEGTVSMVGEAPVSGLDKSRIFENTGSGAWTNSHSHEVTESYRRGVDIDDGVYMFSRGDTTYNYFDFYDSPGGRQVLKAHASNSKSHSFSSVALYKDQVIGNRPDGNDAVTMGIPCGIKPTHLIADEWAMVSVPCGNSVASIKQIFGDDMDAVNGGSAVYGDNGNWVMYENGVNYTGKANDFIEMQDSNEMHLGQGYWIISDKNVTLKADDPAITTRTALDFSDPSTNRPADVAGYYLFDLPAKSGKLKIMVGNPFPRTVHWKDVMEQDDTLTSRVEIGTGINPIMNTTGYVYDTTQSGQPYRAITSAGTPGISDVVKPYQGVWVKKEVGIANAKLCFPFEK